MTKKSHNETINVPRSTKHLLTSLKKGKFSYNEVILYLLVKAGHLDANTVYNVDEITQVIGHVKFESESQDRTNPESMQNHS